MGGMIRRPANKQKATFRSNFNQNKNNTKFGKDTSVPGTKFNWYDRSDKKK